MMKTETPNFDSIQPQFCINARIRKLHRLINSAYQAMMAPYDLRGSMLSILFIIGKLSRTNQKKLAQMLVLDESTISRDLKKLIERRLVVNHVGDDNRNKELELTQNGLELVNELAPKWHHLHQTFETAIGDELNQQIDILTNKIQLGLKQLQP